ncbi:MAG: ubiquitin-like domain-containing protein, partial [Caldilineaceae bacterium]
LLADLDLTPGPLDRLSTPASGLLRQLAPSTPITMARARPLRIVVDGQTIEASTWGSTVRDALTDAGVTFAAYDRALLNGNDATLDTPLPEAEVTVAPATFRRAYGWQALTTAPVQIRLRRALPITVDEGGVPYVVQTTAQTVGEALRQAEVTLYLGDRVEPSLGSSVVSGLRVEIARSTPVSVQVGDDRLKTRTQAQTVGDALSALSIVAAGLDRVEPPLETPLFPNIEIRVTRVWEDIEVQEQIEPFETIYQGDPNLAIDTQQVVNPGAEGIERQRYRVRYENGQEVARTLEDSWIAQAPATRVIAYGQQILPQTAVVDGVPITYWRKVKMLATSYSPAAVGGSNRTYTGDTLRAGIVAIDPKIVPLRSQVFVPGYGIGDALDIGGGIRSRRIDLGYDDASFVSVLRWTDVYLLWPPPPASQITWVVPNYPKPPN